MSKRNKPTKKRVFVVNNQVLDLDNRQSTVNMNMEDYQSGDCYLYDYEEIIKAVNNKNMVSGTIIKSYSSGLINSGSHL